MCVSMGPLNQRDQAGRDRWKKMKKKTALFLGIQMPRLPQSPRIGGSLGARTRWGKAVAGPGVGDQAGRDKWKKMEENFFFSRDSDAPFGPKVRGFEARLGPELDGEKLWRDQVLGTRLGETSGRKWKKTSEDSRLVWGQN